ncbi:MAG: protein-L-isoaspartate(D-aspartate) O-methyltransferase [Rhodospirillaceae bacterium]
MTGRAREILISAIRNNGVCDETVLAALAAVPRDRFVPPELRAFAWDDRPLPIGHDQTISQPLVVAYMTQRLEVLPTHRVLEIGTGSGYQTAVLARLCRHVYTVERRGPLLVEAQRRFAELGLDGITARLGDGTLGWLAEAPFDRIMVTAGAEGQEPPPALTAQLAPGGVLVIPLGDERWEQRLVRIRRCETGFQREELWPVRFVPLVADHPSGSGAPPAA